MFIQRNEVLTCIEESYGDILWVSAVQLKLSGRRPKVAYGKEHLSMDDGLAGCWSATIKSQASGDCWAG